MTDPKPHGMPQGRAERHAAGISGVRTQSGVSDAPDGAQAAKRAIAKAHRERHETALAETLKRAELPEPVREFRWWPGRKHRADFAYPERRILIEVQGGSWGAGHSRADRYAEDRVRQAEAQLMGYVVIEVTPVMIADGRALALIEKALGGVTVRQGEGAER